LRANELDARREVGLIVHEAKIVNKLMATFESDWKSGVAQSAKVRAGVPKDAEPSKVDTEKAMKVLAKELHPIATVKKAVEKVVTETGEEILREGEIKATVKKVVKTVVKQAVKVAVQA
jgi:topoisomerase IA-like protein